MVRIVIIIIIITFVEGLLHTRHYSKCFPCTNPAHLPPKPYEESTITTPILQKKKLRYRKVTWPVSQLPREPSVSLPQELFIH